MDGKEEFVFTPLTEEEEKTAAAKAAENPKERDEIPDEFSIRFYGKHDHGDLPEPTPNPAFEPLTKFLAQAKDATNNYLAPIVEHEKAEKEAATKAAKKKKTEGEETNAKADE